MRIIGGRYGGTPLAAPRGQATRPTGARIREALFSILEAQVRLDGMRVMDLFAGTGAMGLEALSRGAAFCLFVDDAPDARGLIRTNCETLGVMGQSKVYRRDATRLGTRPAPSGPPFDVVLADPPYGKALAENALAAARSGDWLTPDACCVVEEDIRARFAAPDGFLITDRRRYGDTELIFLRLEAG